MTVFHWIDSLVLGVWFGFMIHQPLIINAIIYFYTYKQLYIKTIQFSISTVFCLPTVKCQNSSIIKNSVFHKYTVSMKKKTPVLFQTIQFSISTQFPRQKQYYFKQFNLV